jgi:hypothetical protein
VGNIVTRERERSECGVMSSEEVEITIPKLRPKRQIKQPKRLDDRVLGGSKKRGTK